MTSRPLTMLAAVLLYAATAFAQQPPPGSPPPSDTPAAPITRQPPRTPGGGPPSDMHRPSTMSRSYRGGSSDMSPGSRIAPPGLWWKNPDTIQKLSLTDDQQKKMDAIFQQSRLQLIDLKANLEKQEVILQPMLDANPPDTNKVLAQIDHVAQARAELEKANAKMLLGIRGVLTADQWTKLQTDRPNRRMSYKSPGSGSGGPPPGGGMGSNAAMNGGGGRQFHYAP